MSMSESEIHCVVSFITDTLARIITHRILSSKKQVKIGSSLYVTSSRLVYDSLPNGLIPMVARNSLHSEIELFVIVRINIR